MKTIKIGKIVNSNNNNNYYCLKKTMVHCPFDLRYPNCKTGYTVSKANYIFKACALKMLQFINDSMKTTNKNFNNHIDNNDSCYCNLYNDDATG